MAEEENGSGSGITTLLSFLVGAAIGSTVVLLLNRGKSDTEDDTSEEGPLFI